MMRRTLTLAVIVGAVVLFGALRTSLGQDVQQRIVWLADGAGNTIASVTADTLRGIPTAMLAYNGEDWGPLSVPVSACDDPAKITTVNIALSAGTGNTQLVSLTSDETIYVCGYVLIAGGESEVRFSYGTGTNCGTGNTDLETLSFAAAGDGIAVSNGGAVQFKTAASNALCVERGSSVTLHGRVTYVKQ